jgi:hypothetical protein
MGVDIHMYVVSYGKYLSSDLFSGRNYLWFDKINNNEDEYAYLNWKYTLDENIPEDIRRWQKENNGYYGFKFVRISELLDWFETYKPNITAGWVHKIDAWKYRMKNIPIFEDDIYSCLENNAIVEDWEFLELPDPDDCMEYIINQIKEIPNLETENSYLVVYFDC